jgi:hypothetical protein
VDITPNRDKIMLLLQNVEGSKYNPFIDNYMVLKVNDYVNTNLNEIEQLLDTVERSHEELVLVETESHGLDLFEFLENIGKIIICKADKQADAFYLTIQKSVLN